jgi:hypothetical protein
MNLIYYTLGSNLEYLNILNLNILTLENYYNNNFELLFIVDEKFKDSFEQSLVTKIPYNIFFTESSSINDSSINKLKIFEYEKIKIYDNIIYCDCDILWCGDPNNVFLLINDDKILVSNETHHDELMTNSYWSGNLLTNDEKIKINNCGLQGFNGGFFAFSSKSIKIIENIFKFYIDNIGSINECIEQPYLNVYLFRNDLFDLNLTKLVNHNGYNIDKINGETIIHFAGGPGNYSYKMDKMILFYEKNIKK